MESRTQKTTEKAQRKEHIRKQHRNHLKTKLGPRGAVKIRNPNHFRMAAFPHAPPLAFQLPDFALCYFLKLWQTYTQV